MNEVSSSLFKWRGEAKDFFRTGFDQKGNRILKKRREDDACFSHTVVSPLFRYLPARVLQ
jgi:hypothetical protein